MSTAFESLDKGSIVTPGPIRIINSDRSLFLPRMMLQTRSVAAKRLPTRSHIRIVRPAATFGRNPGDVLIGILDVAGFAVNAILRVDHETG
jgi:hypothetical protein